MKKTVALPGMEQIKSQVKEKDSSPESHDTVMELEEPFEEKELKACWDEYLLELKKQGRQTDYAALNREIKIVNNFDIHLTVPNGYQLLTIENVQLELVTYLRQKLKNKNIKLYADVEKTENKKMIYTNSEKFEYLAEKYPALRQLKSRLDLETDF